MAIESALDQKKQPVRVFSIGKNPHNAVDVSIYKTKKARYVASFYDANGNRQRIERGTISEVEFEAREYVARHVTPEALERLFVESKAAQIVEPDDLLIACGEYVQAREMLKPYGVTVLEAATQHAQWLKENRSSVSTAYAVDHFLEHFRGPQKTAKFHKTHLLRIKKDWNEKLLTEVDHVFINRWIGTLGSKERTRRNYFDEASALFKYAKGMGWFPLDRPTPTANAKRPKAEDTDIETFTPEEVRALLAAAKELKSPAHPVIALICFSGSRTEEIAPEYSDKGRLHWENILPANSKAKS